jgi:hypothetical protein
MFEKWADADALVLDRGGPGATVSRDLHGVDWDHHTYILEVRPAGQAPFRVETKAKVPIFSSPQAGDTVKVRYDAKSHKTEILIDGDPQYDPRLVRERKKADRAAREQALLSGAPAAAGQFTNVDDGPQWIVPEVCPECGARVDQSRASVAEHPACEYCSKPLPCKPVPEDY